MTLSLRFGAVRSVLPGRAARPAVDLELGSGHRVALIGGSGEGKSLLCRLALGMPPRAPLGWEGTLTLDGVDVGPDALVALRGTRIAWLPQGGRESLVPGWSLDRHLGRLARDRDDVLRRMTALGLAPSPRVLACTAEALSEGMIRRFLLALATSGDPDLLVLDEPTAGLDAASRAAVIAAVQGLPGVGLLCATHDLTLAAALAGTFVLVRDGAPVACTDRLDADGPLGHFVRADASLRGTA